MAIEENTTERWAAIPGYVGIYEASNLGVIRSLERVTEWRGTHRRLWARTVSQSVGWDGYHRVKLLHGGVRKSLLVHRLVLLAFVPQPEGRNECNHVDFNRSNNRLNNLEWVNSRENRLHTFNAGRIRIARGSECGTSKLTEADIPIIRARVASGETQASVAVLYGVNHRTISTIVLRRHWKHA